MKALRIRQSAEDDILDIADFYDRQELGTGDYFVSRINEEIAEVLPACAGVHRRRQGFHCFVSRRFPVGIYYKLEIDSTVLVCAVKDQRRDPIRIQDELRQTPSE